MNATAETVARPAWDTRVLPRDYYCPACRTFLGASNATDGSLRVRCHTCKCWKTIKLDALRRDERATI